MCEDSARTVLVPGITSSSWFFLLSSALPLSFMSPFLRAASISGHRAIRKHPASTSCQPRPACGRPRRKQTAAAARQGWECQSNGAHNASHSGGTFQPVSGRVGCTGGSAVRSVHPLGSSWDEERSLAPLTCLPGSFPRGGDHGCADTALAGTALSWPVATDSSSGPLTGFVPAWSKRSQLQSGFILMALPLLL